jgi:hypothetical protein
VPPKARVLRSACAYPWQFCHTQMCRLGESSARADSATLFHHGGLAYRPCERNVQCHTAVVPHSFSARDRGEHTMMTIAGTALSIIAVLAVAIECPKSAAAFGVMAYWLIAHGG